MKRITLDCRTDQTPVVTHAITILKRILHERSGVQTDGHGEGEMSLILDIQPGVGHEGFTIADAQGGLSVTGHDERGLLYGIGRFLRGCHFADDGFVPSSWRGSSVPDKPIRGIYFATHFHNFYHDAPLPEVERYIDELALWGCNVLSVWFDMHHYHGMEDPAAKAMITRLRAILSAAQRAGLGLALTTLGNEAFANSPVHLRADWQRGQNGYHTEPGGHYHVEVCPNKPGGMAQIMDDRRQVLEAFKDLDITYVCIWPYDQGGCTCAACAPWGSNGFLKVARSEAHLIKEFFPDAQIIFSTWYFDKFVDGEWEGIDRIFSDQKPAWIDCMLIDDFGGFPDYPLEHGVPGGFPVVGFPEISMERMWPWGGFGANPRPGHWQKHWHTVREIMSGSFPYSEGIFEDMNKVLQLQFGWDPQHSADEIVHEYAAYEYGPEVACELVSVAHQLEEAQDHTLADKLVFKLFKYIEFNGPRPQVGPEKLYALPRAVNAGPTFLAVQAMDAKLCSWSRKAWRWRILWLRAALDADLHASNGDVTEFSQACLEELATIYHARHAEIPVLPPSFKALSRLCHD